MAREYINWQKVLNKEIPLLTVLNVLPTKGNLVYEYNPFRNYRLTGNKYYYKGLYYTEDELSKDFSITISEDKLSWIGVPNGLDEPILYEKGLLVDFVTDELNLSLDHPIHIVPLYSYDGSVNLIINDGLNIPRLINSRFSATGRNTYEIIDRKGSNDTNIYDLGELFDLDTSLYKIVDKIPKITFLGTPYGGNMKVGNYHFYFKLMDSDGNETDFIAESGLVSVFIGLGSYSSVHTGNKNENSNKLVEFRLDNIDSAYDYISIYYSRYTAENSDNPVYEYVKINKKYNRNSPKIVITGFEETENITVADINTSYNLVDSVKTSAVCLNMLFMGNVKKQSIPYEELQDLSLRILPFLGKKNYDPLLREDYSCADPEGSYIDPKFIYDYTGYWKDELYRFGIVYILPNGLLTPVFNVRGGIRIGGAMGLNYFGFSNIPLKETDKYGEERRRYIKYNENNFLIAENSNEFYYNFENQQLLGGSLTVPFENVKGVCSFDYPVDANLNFIHYIKFFIAKDVKEELQKHVKGFFFVRQTRIPSILAQGITIGIDNEARTPTIPTAGGVLSKLSDSLEKTHVETENINGLNYVSEGFLKRYTFTFKKKSSGLWGSIGKIMGIAALVVGAVAATIVTAGGAAVLGAAVGGAITATAGAIGVSVATAAALMGAAAAGVAAGVVSVAVASTQEIGQAVVRIGAKKRLQGKDTKAPSGYKIVEESDSRKLTEYFDDRIIIKDDSKNEVCGIICPDYTVNQAYYNLIFTGSLHLIKTDLRQRKDKEGFSGESFFTNEGRHFYINEYINITTKLLITTSVMGVPDNAKCVGNDNTLFKARAGEAEEAFRFLTVGENMEGEESDAKKINTDIIRGSFSPYLSFINKTIGPARIVNIYAPGYDETELLDYIEVRMNDNSTYSAITDRISILEGNPELSGDKEYKGSIYEAFRGDCYICQYTLRINRNFNDPSAPYNEEFVDVNTWRDNYDPSNTEKYAEINLGDVNAVPMGMWVTFLLRSSYNLNIRTLDGSNVDETAMTGNPRGYYPVQPMSVNGVFKKPESLIYNKGFSKSISERWNFELPDVPHIKNWFGTRIMYSDIHVNDGYKNGFRIFRGQNYRDYTREYGEIVKLVPFESSLLCVFEHGVALIPVNERAVAGQGAGGNVYINTSNVLPENPKIISDMFGSQWPESVLKVPGKTGDAPLYVYGVDTVAKKIWRTDGNTLECISDFKVQEFLNNNITLGERELTPKIGIRNVKTVYNAFKRDVMFTFYDNTYGCEEKVWNLCWNEILQKFVTFYSWVPSYMENINNVPFSFDRNTSKWIAKLGTSHSESSFADGVTLTNVIIEDSYRDGGAAVENTKIPVKYITKDGEWKTLTAHADKVNKFIAGLSLSNRMLPDKLVHYRIDFELLKDSLENYKLFKIVPLDTTYTKANGLVVNTKGGFILPDDAMFPGAFMPLYGLCFNDDLEEWSEVYYLEGDSYELIESSPSPETRPDGPPVYTYKALYRPEALYSELYYRNSAGHEYADYDDHKLGTEKITESNLPKFQIKDMETLTRLELTLDPNTFIGHTSAHYTLDNPPSTLTPCVNDTNIGNIRLLITIGSDGIPRVHGILLSQHWTIDTTTSDSDRKVWYDLPIFKDITGKRPMLPEGQLVNEDNLVTLINIRANISIEDLYNTKDLSTIYYDNKSKFATGSNLVNAGYYESTVAITPRWNLLFLTSDFWKHGLAGIIDIADDIKPTTWYGKTHPFEFEVVVVNDPSMHKIFSNLELIANKAKPESFHYEIVGECYDFAKDKVNMYFRLEALKALWLYNGANITYNRDFLKVLPKLLNKSADLPHRYFTRQDKINNVEDSYVSITYPQGYDYRHLSGAEIVYYPNRQEYRIWNHAKAVDIDDLDQNDSRSIIAANCQYLEDRWRVTINPILVCYRNEYLRVNSNELLIQPKNSLWVDSVGGAKLPRLPIYNSPIPDLIKALGELRFPNTTTGEGKDNALYGLYKDLYNAIDTTNWLNAPDTSGYIATRLYEYHKGEGEEREDYIIRDYYNKSGEVVRKDWFSLSGEFIKTTYYNSNNAQNRKELDLKDKFMKVRIRYSGEELAVIDFLNTIYRVSYA